MSRLPTVEVLPVGGVPEVRPGDDLAGVLSPQLSALGIRDGDVVVVTQKVVSKAEGRVVPEEGEGRLAWIERETRRVVARRGDLVITETEHGFVCANAGVDASNVEAGFLTLLPLDPDGSAGSLRAAFAERLGVDVAVVVTDTFGRAWRRGLTNVAIGAAGLPSLVDLRGTLDHAGRELESTMVAVADEVAAASGLVMGKASRVPAAIVRGLTVDGTPVPASELIRPPDEDLFRESPLWSISARRTIRSFDEGDVPREVIEEAVLASCTAPSPRDTRPWTFTALVSPAARQRLLRGLADTWRDDLASDGVVEDEARRRVSELGSMLGSAPVLVVPWVRFDAMRHLRDPARAHAEQERFLLSAGAAIQNLLLAIHAQGYGSCWTASTIFGQDMARELVGMPAEWFALGTVAVGRVPAGAAVAAPPPLDLSEFLRVL